MRALTTIRAALAIGLALAPLAPLGAQPRPDIIRGRVTGPDSLPVASANVQVTAVGTTITQQTRTDGRGTFTVVFPSADGDYWVLVQAIGYALRRFEIRRFGDEDVLNADTRLQTPGPQILRPVVSNGQRSAARADMNGDITGSNIRKDLTTLGIDLMGDPAALAMLLPDAIYIPGVDGGPGSFSVYGLDADQNTFTLNGLALSADGLPRDAGIAATISASPDASQPGGAGGLVAATAGSGSNFIERKLSVTGRSPRVQWSDATTKSIGNQPTRLSIGGRASGPITRDRTFYKIAFQMDESSYALRSVIDTDARGLTAAGLAADSVARLVAALNTLGVPLTIPHIPARNRTRAGRVLGSFSYTPATPRFGTLSVAFLGSGSERVPAAPSLLLETPAHSGRVTSRAASISATHGVLVRKAIYASTTVGASTEQSSGDPWLAMPSAVVRVPSALDDGSRVVRSVSIGGSPSLDRSAIHSSVQASSSLKWVSRNGRYSFTLGTDVARRTFRSHQSVNLLGAYAFNSIADLEAGRAASFDRLLTSRAQHGAQTTAGAGINMWWRPDSTLNMSAGVRVDVSRYAARPARNPLVDQLYGMRNDRLPAPWPISPRLSFSKDIGASSQIATTAGGVRQPRFRLTGQGGVFESTPSASLPSAAIDNTGLPSGIQRVSCTGDAVPLPDWRAALIDPTTLATECADGSIGFSASTAPSVTMIAGGYAGVRRMSGTLRIVGPVLGNRFTMVAGAGYASNRHLQRVVDLNFDPTVRFTLADEADRPVFALPGDITSTTGRFAAASARRSSAFDRVNEIRSDLRGSSRTLTLALTPLGYHPRFSYSLSHTVQLNRQMIAGTESTVGSPVGAAWADNPLGQIHRLAIGLSANIRNVVRLSWTARLSSGIPITPRVSGDINGDGHALNDRAFVFDPATARDSSVAAAMGRLLANGSSIAQHCLRGQLGRLSTLTPCRGPWTFQGANALQLLINPLALRMPQRASIQFEIGNPIGAIDLLAHGPARIHGWGQQATPDQTLFYVRGFDAAAQRFLYDVNPRFGSTQPRQNLNRSAPVTVTALVRIDVGPSRERQTLTELLDRGRKTSDPKAAALMLKAALGRAGVPNPLIALLNQSAILGLTLHQADTLSQLSRWFALHLDSVWTPAARALERLPRDYSQAEAYGIYRSAREQSFDLMIRMAPRVKAMLTPAQVRRLPALLQAYLDVRYLKAQRSSSIGMSDGMFPVGGVPVGVAGPGGRE